MDSHEASQIPSEYQNFIIKRREYNGEIELHTVLLPILLVSNDVLKAIDTRKQTSFRLIYLNAYLSDIFETLREDLATILNRKNIKIVAKDQVILLNNSIYINYIQAPQIRFWKFPSSKTLSQVFDYFLKVTNEHKTYHYSINLDFAEIVKLSQSISEVEFTFDKPMILEIREYSSIWLFKHPDIEDEESCEGCRKISMLKVKCPCNNVKYCSESCMERDKRHHMQVCTVAHEEEDNMALDLVEKEDSKMGLTGLTNLGNTCFMSAGIQCLSNANELTEFFLSDLYIAEINETNPLGTGGVLSKKYASLLKRLWFDSKSSYTPFSFKKAIGDFQSMFTGYHQQDSNEFLSFLLDGIHEDLNRIKNKPMTEKVESQGEPDEQVAAKAFETHRLRNDSKVIDLMCGQFKSQVQCPIDSCGKISITFDPYFSVSLPIPGKVSKKIKVYFVPKNSYEIIPIEIDFPKDGEHLINDLANDVIKKLDRKQSSEYVFRLISNYYKEDVSYSDKTPIIKKKLSFKSLAMRELSEMEQAIPKSERIEVLLSVSYFCSEYYKKNMGYLYFFFSNPLTTVKEIREQILMIFYPLYKDKFASKEEYLKFADSEKDPFKIYLESNSRNWQNCYFCKKKCDKCELPPLYQKTMGNLQDSIPKSESNFNIQFNFIFSTKSHSLMEMDDVENFFLSTGGNLKSTSFQEKPKFTLFDCLEKFREPEQLGEENTWYCSSCKEHRDAKKILEIYSVPQILVFHLKRFKEGKKYGMSGMSKIDSFVDYPLEVDLSEYVLSVSNKKSSSADSQPLIYELFGVVNHMGSISFGHYTAYCKNPKTQGWYLFDDTTVTPVDSHETVVNKNAYILFYKRKN